MSKEEEKKGYNIECYYCGDEFFCEDATSDDDEGFCSDVCQTLYDEENF